MTTWLSASRNWRGPRHAGGLGLTLALLAALLAACGGKSDALPWRDDFSDPTSGWQLETDETAEVGYFEGTLRIVVKAPNRSAWAWAGRRLYDFHLTVEATQVAGPDDNEYGVQVRMQDHQHFYRFAISGDGYYQVSKYDGAAWEVLSAEWPTSDAIRQGMATNVLEVVCIGPRLTFIVNGETLVEVRDSAYRWGDIGLYAGKFYTPGDVEIRFDDLVVEEP